MAAAVQQPSPMRGGERKLFLASLRKYNLDPARPWWSKVWFRAVFLPVVRFSFKRMCIGAPAGLRPDGTVEILEEMGVFTDEQLANDSCPEGPKGEFYQVKPILLNARYPQTSVQLAGHSYPGATQMDRFSHPVTDLQPVPRSSIRQSLALAGRGVDNLNRILTDSDE